MISNNAVCIFQDMQISGIPYPSAASGHANAMNSGAGHTMHNMYNHGTAGPQFTNNAMTKPPYIGATDVTTLSPAEVYRQQNEVTATVCIFVYVCTFRVFMCFEN